MKKHIVIVLNTSWNVYNFRLNLLKKLKNDGYAISVIAPRDRYSQLLINEGFNHIHLEMNNDGTNVLQELKLMFHFFLLYRRTKPDIILQYTIKPNIYGTLMATLLRIPVINNISGLGTVFLKEKVTYRFARLLYKGVLGFPKKVFFQNKDDYQEFLKRRLIKSDKAQVIPGSGIDTNRFIPINNNKDSSKFYFLMIARLIKDKGIVEYIEAIKTIKSQYPNVKFQLIGELYLSNPTAIKQEQLNSWISSDIIEYLGSTDNIEEVISKVDCVVLPSYREGLSRVLLEAASMEKPIITTNVPGCRDIVTDGINGFLCKVKDSHSLAKSMAKMIDLSKEDRNVMGIKSREKVLKEFDESNVINHYSKTITKYIKKEKRIEHKKSIFRRYQSFGFRKI